MLRKHHFHTGLWSLRSCRARSGTPDGNEGHGAEPLRVVTGVMECPTCGLFQRIPSLAGGQVAECCRCGAQLERRRGTTLISTPLAFCIASLAFYLALLVSALMTLNVHGRQNTISIHSGPIELVHQGLGIVATVVVSCTILLPGLVLGMMLLILYAGSRPELPRWICPVLAWYERLRPWSMIEVYVIGLLVAYSKLVDLAIVNLHAGTFLVGALMFTMAALDSTFDAEMIWAHGSIRSLPGLTSYDATRRPLPPSQNMLACSTCQLVLLSEAPVPDQADMGDCPRCGQILRRRKLDSVQATLSFLISAFLFYIPANLLPVMTVVWMGKGAPSTIMGGVFELWRSGLYFLAVLVLFASITLPCLKIVSLSAMLYCEWRRKAWHLVGMSKLYRVVVLIGRWSMIDVFMVSILVGVVRFAFLSHVNADTGVVFFMLVVILTIFAADVYDPRGLWDAVGLNAFQPVHPVAGDPGEGGLQKEGHVAICRPERRWSILPKPRARQGQVYKSQPHKPGQAGTFRLPAGDRKGCA
ncbi:paraquat-inducible protein A [Oecophyllibacter saccharovorans]|nr:paraquat-inducible protein A [Oecophyllibacter saccharovorans]